MPESIVVFKSGLAEAACSAGISREKAEEYQRGATLGFAKNRVYSQIENSGGGRLIIKSKDGEEGYINKDSVNKMLSSYVDSVSNGFNEAQHFAAVADIVNLYGNSTKVLTHPDKKGSHNVKAINRFVAPLYENNFALITGKEIVENGRKIYNLELMKLGRLEGLFVEEESKKFHCNPATSHPH